MPPQCFVCNLPILSHQVGLRWQGGSGVDDLLREQINMVSKNIKFLLHGYRVNDEILLST